MISKEQYVQYLLSTPNNHTCSHLAEHLDGVSHDTVSDFLRRAHFTPRQVWELVRPQLADSAEACLILDDSMQDKRYSRFIALVKRQYSGAVGGLVRGIGVVNLVHSSGVAGDFYPIDYRIYAPEVDGKTKNEHVRELLVRAVTDTRVQARTVLFDSWYAAADHLKLVHRLGLVFYTTLKSTRLVSLSAEAGYGHLDALDWTPERLEQGVSVKLKEVPFRVRVFKVVAPDGDIDGIITTAPDPTLTAQAAQQTSDVRWQVEDRHRGLTQLTGSDRCQCRTARSQRTHLACCYHAWVSLAVHAQQVGKTLYQLRADLFRDYLRTELRHPHIPVLHAC
jgi:hypothetical protein